MDTNQKNYKKRSILPVMCMMLVGVLLCAIFVLSKSNILVFKKKEIKAQTIHATYVIETDDNYNELIDSADYVFVGTVENNVGTRYTDEDTFVDSDNQSHTVYNIFTQYEVKVTQNIKGNINEDSIIVEKLGGIDKDASAVHILEGDVLPKESKRYIFFVNYINGRYTTGGEDSTIRLTDNNLYLVEEFGKRVE